VAGLGANVEYNSNTLIVRNSLFPEGQVEHFEVLSEYVDVTVDEETMLYCDPNFVEDAENPHRLSRRSPCIDSGTFDYPIGFIYPYYCLDGNGRILGNGIDMGCYESNYTISNDEEIKSLRYSLSNFPNPFNTDTRINFSLPNDAKVDLVVYNIKGQKVKELVKDIYEKGQHCISWNGKDDSGKNVGSGVYFYSLISNGKVKSTSRMILLK